jgi:peptidoglycan/LPS O-acetylase OafA/YrhL
MERLVRNQRRFASLRNLERDALLKAAKDPWRASSVLPGARTLHTAHAHASGPPVEHRVPALDGLRGIAILLVMVLHFALYGSERPAGVFNRLAYTGLLSGWVGVDLFFVLSGFLITGILLNARGRQHYFRNFYMRRVLRIFPLYYASLFVFLFVLPTVMPGNAELQTLHPETPWYLLYLTNVRVAQDGWIPSGMLGHFWSLAVEEQFYLFWPLVVLVCRTRTLLYACIGILIGSPLLRLVLHETGNTTAAYVLTPARFDSLAVGALLAILANTGGLARCLRPARVLSVTSALGILAMAVRYRGFPAEAYLIGTLGYSLLAIFFGSILVIALNAAPVTLPGRLLSSRVLKFFGRYSYGLYVVHQPVLFLLPAWWSVDAWQPALGSWFMAYLVFSASATLLCLALALGSWYVLEDRFLRLKSRFAHPATEGARLEAMPRLTASPR